MNADVDTPRVSVIVCTRNRVSKLMRCLEHVSDIRSAMNWELIVVDNGSTDETPRFLDGFVRGFPRPARVVPEPAPGGARNRNAGAEAARGEILIFLDDDCYPQPDIVDQYARIFEDPTLGFASGRIRPYRLGRENQGAEKTLGLRESEVEVRYSAGRPVPCGIIQGGNMALRRRALMAVGGFDVRMGPGTRFAAEDWEIATRMGGEGWSGGYFPGPAVAHDHLRTPEEARIRLRSYHVGMGAVHLKLIANPRTRLIYLPHILRRHLGDMKFHQLKVATQLYGGMLFLRESRGHPLDAPRPRRAGPGPIRT